MSAPTLSGNTLSHTTAYSGFQYPSSFTVTPLLSNGTVATGNAVMQQSAMTFRQATLTFIATSSTQMATHRTIYQASTAVTFVDHTGASYNVMVTGFNTAVIPGVLGETWQVDLTMVEVP